MENPKSAARMIAVLLLLQMACGPIVNFVLLQPVLGRDVFLENAAAHPPQVGVAVLMGLAMSAFSVGIAIVATPLFSRYSAAMARWLFAIAVAGFALAVVENVNVLSMLSLSQTYASANFADSHLLQTLAVTVTSVRASDPVSRSRVKPSSPADCSTSSCRSRSETLQPSSQQLTFVAEQASLYQQILEAGQAAGEFQLVADPGFLARSFVALEDGYGTDVLSEAATAEEVAERLLHHARLITHVDDRALQAG